MRVYMKGVALGLGLLLLVLVVQRHFRSTHSVGKAHAKRGKAAGGRIGEERASQARSGSAEIEEIDAERFPNRAKMAAAKAAKEAALNAKFPNRAKMAAAKAAKEAALLAKFPNRARMAAAEKAKAAKFPNRARMAQKQQEEEYEEEEEEEEEEEDEPTVSHSSQARSPARSGGAAPAVKLPKRALASKEEDDLVLEVEEEVTNLGEIDPVSATEPMVIAQQDELDKSRFGFKPKREPRVAAKVTNSVDTWLKDMKYPDWYTESVKRSRVYGKEKDFVGDGNLWDGPCPNAEKVKQQNKENKIKTFGHVAHGEFLKVTKNPCWYEDAAHKRLLRCLPYFYVGGVAKCGTTDLYKRLRLHPHILEGELKEYHWWDRLRYGAHMEILGEINEDPMPLDTYSKYILGDGVESMKRSITTAGFSNLVCGDGSPSYLWDPFYWPFFQGNEGCPEPKIVTGSLIKHATPNAKIFLIFRHPTPRLFSRFLSRIPRTPAFKGATPKMFHDFVVKGVATYKRCFKEHSIRECAFNETVYDDAVVRILEGMYSVFLEDWLRIFPKEQILFMRSEDYSEDIEGHMIQSFDFLKVATLNYNEMKAVALHFTANVGQNYESVGAMLPETIEILNEFYKPFVLRLHELIGQDRFLWKDIKVT